MASVFTRLVFRSEAGNLDGGHYKLLKEGQISPDLLSLQWCPITTLDGLDARVPISPDTFHTFKDDAKQQPSPLIFALQHLTPGKKVADLPRKSIKILQNSTPTHQASVLNLQASALIQPTTPVEKPSTNPPPHKRHRFEFVSDDEDLAGKPTTPKLSFTDMSLELLNSTPGVIILRHSCFLLKHTYYVGVLSSQATTMKPDATIQIDNKTSIKIIQVQISQPPLAGLYMWIRKAKRVPDSWLPFPGDMDYQLLTFKPSLHCLYAAFNLVCLSKRKTIWSKYKKNFFWTIILCLDFILK